MICVPIVGPTYALAFTQLQQARRLADLVELRLDRFENLRLDEIQKLQSEFDLPMLFTLRPVNQGGAYTGAESSRIAQLKMLASLKPAYLDLEYTLPHSLFEYIKDRFPTIKTLVSYHDFKNTPASLAPLLNMLHQYPADIIKIAAMPSSTVEALQMVSIQSENTLAMSMGPLGVVTRILAPLHRMPWTYSSLDEQTSTAPGQVGVDTLVNVYHYKKLNPQTTAYALLGNPIEKSFSELLHNPVMEKLGLNAVYVKMLTTPSELKPILDQASYLGFGGFSVTMPLKEEVLKFLDAADPAVTAIGAANTLVFKNHKVFGYNTDGIGALDAIAEIIPPQDKHLVIAGAGGASRAIIYEALKRGMTVTVVNRTKEKAQALARQFGCQAGDFDPLPDYDIFLNSTPVELDPALIQPGKVIMDVSAFKETPFLQQARTRNCKVIAGFRMWIYQAIGQYKVWFPDLRLDEIKPLFESIWQESD